MIKKLLAILPALVVVFAFIDVNFQLLKDLGLNANQANWIKLFGLIFTSLLPAITNIFKKDESLASRPEDDGKEKDKEGAVIPTKGF